MGGGFIFLNREIQKKFAFLFYTPTGITVVHDRVKGHIKYCL